VRLSQQYEFPDQDSAQMMLGQGYGNTNLAQNFSKKAQQHNEGNLLGRHSGDNGVVFEDND